MDFPVIFILNKIESFLLYFEQKKGFPITGPRVRAAARTCIYSFIYYNRGGWEVSVFEKGEYSENSSVPYARLKIARKIEKLQ
jgi:hypothetical protein